MDDLSSLSWSSSPPFSQNQQQNQASKPNRYAPQSAFDILTPSSSSYSSRTPSPSIPHRAPPQANKPSPTAAAASSSSSDAFSSLLSFGSGSKDAGLSMAERQAKLHEEAASRAAAQRSEAQRWWVGMDAWTGGAGGPVKPQGTGGSTAQSQASRASSPSIKILRPTTSSTPSIRTSSPLTPVTRTPSISSSAPAAAPDPWDFDLLSSEPAAPAPAANDPFDLLGDVAPSVPARSSTPGSLDFGETSGRSGPSSSLSGADDTDDILGALGRPVEERPAPAPTPAPAPSRSPAPRPPRSPAPSAPTRTSSPPPHIIGQLVEMGFSPIIAREALLATDSGTDVAAAAEMLIASQVPDSSRPPSPPPVDAAARPERERAERHAARRGRRPPQQPEQDHPALAESSDSAQNVADDLMAQASALSASMFSKASGYFAAGRALAQKALEEQRARARDAEAAERERRELEERRRRWEEGAQSGFRDNDDVQGGQEERPEEPVRVRPAQQRQKQVEVEEGDLLSGEPVKPRAAPPKAAASPPPAADPRKPYVSSNRHRVPARTPTSASPSPSPVPPPAPPRTNPSASASSLASCATHKEAGNASFKLGSYPAASTSYTSALSYLPSGHILTLPLLTNRATTHLKMGDASAALADASSAIELVGDDVRASEGVDVGEGHGKALRARAQAGEMLERWAEAKADWERLAGLSYVSSGLRTQAFDGARRCRLALNPPPPPSSKPKSKPRPTAFSTSTSNVAATRARAAANAEAEEDAARIALKDGVDARLVAWKAGKETNVRALLSSLDLVLWPELAWKSFGMHELVTENGVKKAYMRAIGKVHPDKLTAKNTTLEQRMIANGVFGTLNEAWNAMKI